MWNSSSMPLMRCGFNKPVCTTTEPFGKHYCWFVWWHAGNGVNWISWKQKHLSVLDVKEMCNLSPDLLVLYSAYLFMLPMMLCVKICVYNSRTTSLTCKCTFSHRAKQTNKRKINFFLNQTMLPWLRPQLSQTGTGQFYEQQIFSQVHS